jgi:hypothetical protein
MKLIADRLLLSRACFFLGFTIVKLKNKNKMKNVHLKFGLQHRRGLMSIAHDYYRFKFPVGNS